MKKLLTFLTLTVQVEMAPAQVQDDFSDGNFSVNPVWSGDNPKFEVDANFQLHLNAPAIDDSAFLSTPIPAIGETQWYFFYNMDFAPSASNYLTVYLLSDNADLSQTVDGYFLRMGENGTADAFNLYKKQGGINTLIIAGIAGNAASDPSTASLKVTRDVNGNWNLYSDLSGGNNYSLEGTAFDNTFTNAGFFGFKCTYTSSRSTLYWFDNVYLGSPVVDTIPPQLASLNVLSQNELDVFFSENVEQSTSEDESNYSADNGIGQPSNATRDGIDASLVHLTFASSFPNGITNLLSVSNVSDDSSNVMTSSALSFSFYQPQTNDVMINEIMADPDPPVSLPNAEFAELFNASSFPIELANWTFSDASATSTFNSFVLEPDSFVIVCDDDVASQFASYGNVIALTTMPSLNNDGDQLTLRDNNGNKINSVNYNPSWYQDVIKEAGGWSLELIDPSNPCGGSSNWIASNDVSGGTPDKPNSVFGSNPDVTPPEVLNATVIDPFTIQIFFSESLDSAVASITANYSIDNGIGEPLSVAVIGPDFTSVQLTLAISLLANTLYTVTVNNVSDCIGNVISENNIAQLAIPEELQAGDLLINEILFNPASGGFDYVEIYNNTNKIFDLKDLRIANTDEQGLIDAISVVSPEGYLIFPSQYIVITEDADWVRQHYTSENPDWFAEISDLPSYNDDEGTCVLLNQLNERIDQLHYFNDWHFALIDDEEGIALERISFITITQDSLNWHSAASTVGYGTPTYQNSQYSEPDLNDEITISPVAFSPDQDGFNDVLNIGYQFDEAGYTANIRLYNSEGRLVRDLVHNALLSQTGVFTWDGINDNEEKVRSGIYIVYLEVFNLEGTVKKYKKACVAGGKIN